MQFYFQVAWACFLVFAFVMGVYGDFQPRKAGEAAGFPGFIATCISIGIFAGLSYGAGAFSLLFKSSQ